MAGLSYFRIKKGENLLPVGKVKSGKIVHIRTFYNNASEQPIKSSFIFFISF